MTEEDENQDDLEEEENPEDSSESEPELSYEEKLEAWFKELEEKHGVEYANEYRKKIAAEQEIKHWFNGEKWLEYFRELQVKQIDKAIFLDVEIAQRCREYMKKSEERLQKFIADSDARDRELQQKTLEMLEKIEARDKAFNDKIMAGLEKDDKEDSEFQKKLNLIADLKIKREKAKA